MPEKSLFMYTDHGWVRIIPQTPPPDIEVDHRNHPRKPVHRPCAFADRHCHIHHRRMTKICVPCLEAYRNGQRYELVEETSR